MLATGAAAPPSTHTHDVCTDTPDRAQTWHPFRFPSGIDYYRALPCEENPEVNTHGALVPVTHVGGPNRGPTDSGGLWFYYARGCSDLLWDVGRVLTARNRVHAAMLVEQRHSQHSTRDTGVRTGTVATPQHLTDREAIGRIASWLRRRTLRPGRKEDLQAAWWRPLAIARRWAGANASVESVLADAARGLYGHCPSNEPLFTTDGALRPCVCTGRNMTRGTSKRRAQALSLLAGDKQLSLHSEPLLRQLPVDTLVLLKQPQGSSVQYTTELWDVRDSPQLSRHLENATAHPEVVARARWAVGADYYNRSFGSSDATVACAPATTWHTCMACHGSRLEVGCNGTFEEYRRRSEAFQRRAHTG